ncbi:hypothetical protein METBIDRAFT_47089 [Metschnikowia bicuspidata var. bicuspidata NRRL YB-4993]|uniref:Uncharacterized protein n=1 Tax=Metschnikowia bicuspidata var. bicuspidata NRRL YB-4993 TaxID=869754 RepID=A0A1A0H5Z3_9ASCO|nr:hypothetical protein METBIDRAFT_47089 [Metschnikowia bicuspidata var. bicuspidata NRRL YB-4993]OBA19375.1 hypothetical protein METBIDRAFT_47089 [Metschnikowia bicuspidata var. bicuspidata NRRL YB-4993]
MLEIEKPVHKIVDEATKGLEQLEVQEKKPKQRKAQSEEEYLEQKRQFAESGPQVNSDDWLFDEDLVSSLDNTKKFDRVHILHACEKAYFIKDYRKCLELIQLGERLFGVELDDDSVNDGLKTDFQNAGRKTRKSTKVERHVVELLHIKEACLKKSEDARLESNDSDKATPALRHDRN